MISVGKKNIEQKCIGEAHVSAYRPSVVAGPYGCSDRPAEKGPTNLGAATLLHCFAGHP